MTQVTVTAEMRADFEVCMAIIVEEFRNDFRDVVRAGPYQTDDGRTITPAEWIANWRKELEANGSRRKT